MKSREAGIMGKKKAATAGEPKKKGPGKGGPRPNSGRNPIHPGGTVQMSLRVPNDVAEWIASTGESQSTAVTKAVRFYRDSISKTSGQ